MTVEELAGKRYGGEFVFMFGHLEGRTRFVFECFDPRPDHEGKNTYMVSRSQEQASRSSKYTIWNRILWIETLFHNIATCGIRNSS